MSSEQLPQKLHSNTAPVIEVCTTTMSLELPPLVRSGLVIFLFFVSLSQVPRSWSFYSVFHPLSKVGNSRLHQTCFDYFGFYGPVRDDSIFLLFFLKKF